MKKVGIVSCDKWIGRLEEDKNLKEQLNSLGIDAKIISWQKPLDDDFDLLVVRSVWGYQNHYEEFKEWLLTIKEKNILLLNDQEMILNNVRKDIQFEILRKNKIDFIDTDFSKTTDIKIPEDKSYIIKPTISGSGENTYAIKNNSGLDIPNMIDKENIDEIYSQILKTNKDCKIMMQPYIPEINNGEYSCIFIAGRLTHTMLRFPNVFHEKKKPVLVRDVPQSVLELAHKVEQIKDYKNYLYMRVDMVLINDIPKIMEVELTDPDLLTKYIDDQDVKQDVVKTFAKQIERRLK